MKEVEVSRVFSPTVQLISEKADGENGKTGTIEKEAISFYIIKVTGIGVNEEDTIDNSVVSTEDGKNAVDLEEKENFLKDTEKSEEVPGVTSQLGIGAAETESYDASAAYSSPEVSSELESRRFSNNVISSEEESDSYSVEPCDEEPSTPAADKSIESPSTKKRWENEPDMIQEANEEVVDSTTIVKNALDASNIEQVTTSVKSSSDPDSDRSISICYRTEEGPLDDADRLIQHCSSDTELSLGISKESEHCTPLHETETEGLDDAMESNDFESKGSKDSSSNVEDRRSDSSSSEADATPWLKAAPNVSVDYGAGKETAKLRSSETELAVENNSLIRRENAGNSGLYVNTTASSSTTKVQEVPESGEVDLVARALALMDSEDVDSEMKSLPDESSTEVEASLDNTVSNPTSVVEGSRNESCVSLQVEEPGQIPSSEAPVNQTDPTTENMVLVSETNASGDINLNVHQTEVAESLLRLASSFHENSVSSPARCNKARYEDISSDEVEEPTHSGELDIIRLDVHQSNLHETVTFYAGTSEIPAPLPQDSHPESRPINVDENHQLIQPPQCRKLTGSSRRKSSTVRRVPYYSSSPYRLGTFHSPPLSNANQDRRQSSVSATITSSASSPPSLNANPTSMNLGPMRYVIESQFAQQANDNISRENYRCRENDITVSWPSPSFPTSQSRLYDPNMGINNAIISMLEKEQFSHYHNLLRFMLMGSIPVRRSSLDRALLCQCSCSKLHGCPRDASRCLKKHTRLRCWLCFCTWRVKSNDPSEEQISYRHHNNLKHREDFMKKSWPCRICLKPLPFTIDLRNHMESEHFGVSSDYLSVETDEVRVSRLARRTTTLASTRRNGRRISAELPRIDVRVNASNISTSEERNEWSLPDMELVRHPEPSFPSQTWPVISESNNPCGRESRERLSQVLSGRQSSIPFDLSIPKDLRTQSHRKRSSTASATVVSSSQREENSPGSAAEPIGFEKGSANVPETSENPSLGVMRVSTSSTSTAMPPTAENQNLNGSTLPLVPIGLSTKRLPSSTSQIYIPRLAGSIRFAIPAVPIQPLPRPPALGDQGQFLNPAFAANTNDRPRSRLTADGVARYMRYDRVAVELPRFNVEVNGCSEQNRRSILLDDRSEEQPELPSSEKNAIAQSTTESTSRQRENASAKTADQEGVVMRNSQIAQLLSRPLQPQQHSVQGEFSTNCSEMRKDSTGTFPSNNIIHDLQNSSSDRSTQLSQDNYTDVSESEDNEDCGLNSTVHHLPKPQDLMQNDRISVVSLPVADGNLQNASSGPAAEQQEPGSRFEICRLPNVSDRPPRESLPPNSDVTEIVHPRQAEMEVATEDADCQHRPEEFERRDISSTIPTDSRPSVIVSYSRNGPSSHNNVPQPQATETQYRTYASGPASGTVNIPQHCGIQRTVTAPQRRGLGPRYFLRGQQPHPPHSGQYQAHPSEWNASAPPVPHNSGAVLRHLPSVRDRSPPGLIRINRHQQQQRMLGFNQGGQHVHPVHPQQWPFQAMRHPNPNANSVVGSQAQVSHPLQNQTHQIIGAGGQQNLNFQHQRVPPSNNNAGVPNNAHYANASTTQNASQSEQVGHLFPSQQYDSRLVHAPQWFPHANVQHTQQESIGLGNSPRGHHLTNNNISNASQLSQVNTTLPSPASISRATQQHISRMLNPPEEMNASPECFWSWRGNRTLPTEADHNVNLSRYLQWLHQRGNENHTLGRNPTHVNAVSASSAVPISRLNQLSCSLINSRDTRPSAAASRGYDEIYTRPGPAVPQQRYISSNGLGISSLSNNGKLIRPNISPNTSSSIVSQASNIPLLLVQKVPGTSSSGTRQPYLNTAINHSISDSPVSYPQQSIQMHHSRQIQNSRGGNNDMNLATASSVVNVASNLVGSSLASSSLQLPVASKISNNPRVAVVNRNACGSSEQSMNYQSHIPETRTETVTLRKFPAAAFTVCAEENLSQDQSTSGPNPPASGAYSTGGSFHSSDSAIQGNSLASFAPRDNNAMAHSSSSMRIIGSASKGLPSTTVITLRESGSSMGAQAGLTSSEFQLRSVVDNKGSSSVESKKAHSRRQSEEPESYLRKLVGQCAKMRKYTPEEVWKNLEQFRVIGKEKVNETVLESLPHVRGIFFSIEQGRSIEDLIKEMIYRTFNFWITSTEPTNSRNGERSSLAWRELGCDASQVQFKNSPDLLFHKEWFGVTVPMMKASWALNVCRQFELTNKDDEGDREFINFIAKKIVVAAFDLNE
jgi:hypothetical protein